MNRQISGLYAGQLLFFGREFAPSCCLLSVYSAHLFFSFFSCFSFFLLVDILPPVAACCLCTQLSVNFTRPDVAPNQIEYCFWPDCCEYGTELLKLIFFRLAAEKWKEDLTNRFFCFVAALLFLVFRAGMFLIGKLLSRPDRKLSSLSGPKKGGGGNMAIGQRYSKYKMLKHSELSP